MFLFLQLSSERFLSVLPVNVESLLEDVTKCNKQKHFWRIISFSYIKKHIFCNIQHNFKWSKKGKSLVLIYVVKGSYLTSAVDFHANGTAAISPNIQLSILSSGSDDGFCSGADYLYFMKTSRTCTLFKPFQFLHWDNCKTPQSLRHVLCFIPFLFTRFTCWCFLLTVYWALIPKTLS